MRMGGAALIGQDACVLERHVEQVATSLERRQEGRRSEKVKELCTSDNGRGWRVKWVVSQAGLHEGDDD